MPDTFITPRTKRKLPPAKEILMVKKIVESLNNKYPCRDKNLRKFFAVFSDIGIDGYWEVNCTDEKVWRDEKFQKVSDSYWRMFRKVFRINLYFGLVHGSFIDRQYKKQLSKHELIKIGAKFSPFYEKTEL